MRFAVPLLLVAVAAALLAVLLGGGTGVPIGAWLDPVDGVYRTARLGVHPAQAEARVDGLGASVQLVRDSRGVPHIFADKLADASAALGYAVAQDRLFQLDFQPRVAAGRLAEVFGPDQVETDRYLRRTGMAWAARRDAERIRAEGGPELELATAFAAGVNAYLATLRPADYPIEMRLLGYAPEPWSLEKTLLLQQLLHFDLTFNSDKASYGPLEEALGDQYDVLYPTPGPFYVPILPDSPAKPPAAIAQIDTTAPTQGRVRRRYRPLPTLGDPSVAPALPELLPTRPLPLPRGLDTLGTSSTDLQMPADPLRLVAAAIRGGEHPLVTVGYEWEGKGSNSWAVFGTRSATGQPILANDMHLRLSLPSIWYEAHLVTPEANVYGVTFPGAPLPIAAFTDYVAWGFTNTGADQIDHYRLTLDAARSRYRHDGRWRSLELVPDTIFVAGEEAVLDTLRFTHWGPMLFEDEPVAIRWTAHEPNRALRALHGMTTAHSAAAFETALRDWDGPMQNVLYATSDGDVRIRTTGLLPIRAGGTGAGLLRSGSAAGDSTAEDSAAEDSTAGDSAAGDWTGFVPFDEMPAADTPPRGYLFSANQPPAGPDFPYYLGHDWRAAYRSLRIDSLMRGSERHRASDLRRYQADVHAVQSRLFGPLLARLDGLDERTEALRDLLVAWDGEASLERNEPLAFMLFLDALEEAVWDEWDEMDRAAPPGLAPLPRPSQPALYNLLATDPASRWFDVASTAAPESADDLLRQALTAAGDSLRRRYGADPDSWRWGAHHTVEFQHLTRSDRLAALWRGPFPFPGFEDTVSPGGGMTTRHSASWRVVVDFADGEPRAQGVYPGGQSGNPFSANYDLHLPVYLANGYYDLERPATADALLAPAATLVLRPAE